MSDRETWIGEASGVIFESAICDGCGAGLKYGGRKEGDEDYCGACWYQPEAQDRLSAEVERLTQELDAALAEIKELKRQLENVHWESLGPL